MPDSVRGEKRRMPLLLQDFHTDIQPVTGRCGGGEIAHRHDSVTASPEEPGNVGFVNTHIKNRPAAFLTANDRRLFRLVREGGDDKVYEVVNTGNRLHDKRSKKESPVPLLAEPGFQIGGIRPSVEPCGPSE